MNRVILFNKPFGVLSQFTDKGTQGSPRPTLSAFIGEKGFYPAGRLDRDSEGLMVLTDNGALQARISNPKYKLAKTYWVQVEGTPDETALAALRAGVTLKDGKTAPAQVALMEAPPDLWERDPPVRFRKSVPDAWLSIRITRRPQPSGAPHDRTCRIAHPAPDPRSDRTVAPERPSPRCLAFCGGNRPLIPNGNHPGGRPKAGGLAPCPRCNITQTSACPRRQALPKHRSTPPPR